jgi:hypothetical protein
MTSQAGTLLKQDTKIAILGCGAVKPFKADKLTRAQKLKKALASCRKRFRHAKPRRASCEAKARRFCGATHRSKGKRPTKTRRAQAPVMQTQSTAQVSSRM